MLTPENLPEWLTALGFDKKGAIFSKTIGTSVIQVNASRQEIAYPEAAGLVINERQTCNFEANENFVVLECVCRLLEKGYRPEHIELEPKWKLGRGASGGRADILVKDHFGKPLLIIECKTAGAEFRKAWNKTRQDGDQIFSYAQQISETRFLCLYTSDVDAGALVYTRPAISSPIATTTNTWPTIRSSRGSGRLRRSGSDMPSGATPTSSITRPRASSRTISSLTRSAKTNIRSRICMPFPPATSRKSTTSSPLSCASTTSPAGKTPSISW